MMEPLMLQIKQEGSRIFIHFAFFSWQTGHVTFGADHVISQNETCVGLFATQL